MGYFNLSVFKSPIAQPSVRWVNTYTLRVPDATSPDEVPVGIAESFVEYEREFLFDNYQITQTTLSTWAPDGTPYNPASFVTTPWQEPGLRDDADALQLSLRDVLYVRRRTTSGRNGKLMYRGCLYVGDVENPAGEYGLLEAAPIKADFEAAVSSLEGSMPIEGFDMVLITADPDDLRPITALELAGVRSVSRNHRWYNQTS